MTAMEYLSQVRYLKYEIDQLMVRRQNLEDRMTGLSSMSYGPRVQTSTEDKMARLSAKLDGIDRKIVARIEKEQRLIETIQTQIDNMPDAKYRELLSLRFLCCLKWETVADRMGYTERNIHKVKRKAYAAFAEQYKEFL